MALAGMRPRPFRSCSAPTKRWVSGKTAEIAGFFSPSGNSPRTREFRQALLKIINPFTISPNQHYGASVPFRRRGVSRSSRTLATECGGRGVAQCVAACTDERHLADGQVVWFRYPDAGIPLATTLTRRVGHGGQQARCTRKSTKQPLKPARREGREVSTEPVVPAACIFFCRRAMGAASSRPSLRPLTPEGERDQHHSGSTCRGRALLCLHTVIARRLRGYDGCGGGAIFCLNRGSPTTRVHGIAQSRDSSPGGHTASRRLSLPLPSVSFRRCC